MPGVRNRQNDRQSDRLTTGDCSSAPLASDDGWRREPGADEVRERYMDSKFGGEGADMSESVMG